MEFDIRPLFIAAGIENPPQPGIVSLHDRMEIPEENPHDEWITLGFSAMKQLKENGCTPKTIADVGTGNGALAIGAAHIFRPEKIILTDIVPEVLPHCERNLKQNIAKGSIPHITKSAGRDAEPLPEDIDLIVFSPSPLMVADSSLLTKGLARTTLTERELYLKHAQGSTDILSKWSVLPWCVFLSQAKKKLSQKGIILGLYSGRIPFEAIKEAYDRAGLQLSVIKIIVKRQQDPIYLKEYAEYEQSFLGDDTFDFYPYEEAQKILRENGVPMPGVSDFSDEEIKQALREIKISATEAHKQALAGKDVAHLGHALVGTLP